ncbi:hypothetical protein SAMN05192558_11582 [Actinokineospora alba]|uniref:ABC-2 family transporter protein n=1 Tax=Actinokineospora alba TaxID=504798 RepID=A0A1H0VSR8_9PSEU|nr:ABC transporter permease [Actinokineospora alba]TDP70118.1 hypothetical protein C8E96_5718 [Actinokineospora alba]SDI38675.1 hypothetical protein SAMN05421871_104433 [Actinokineospora alba]SDP81414.1 hypothetical protein SAMN05192558_11582 [Actinokineospora alba]
MTWVAWRQQRAQLMVAFALVALVAAVMVFVRIDVSSMPGDQGQLSDRYNQFLSYVPMVMLVLPVLLGMFAGAPVFAREIEQGTHIFGLTQSISRSRWWATKLAVAGLPIIIAMATLGIVNAWALGPLNFIMSGRMRTPLFESQGLVLGAYTAVAFAIGATAGLLVRNTLAAMAITLGGYTAMLVVVSNAARPAYADPTYSTGLLPTDVWRVESGYLDGAGKPVSIAPEKCGMETIAECLAGQGVRSEFAWFHAGERFWSFQAIEAGLFAALTAAVLALGAWAVHRRLR